MEEELKDRYAISGYPAIKLFKVSVCAYECVCVCVRVGVCVWGEGVKTLPHHHSSNCGRVVPQSVTELSCIAAL